jgi:hypothetical protein
MPILFRKPDFISRYYRDRRGSTKHHAGGIRPAIDQIAKKNKVIIGGWRNGKKKGIELPQAPVNVADDEGAGRRGHIVSS